MIAVVQRVSSAAVVVLEPSHRAAIERGLCVLLCVEAGDAEKDADWMAGKLARLRLFPDQDGRMNRSVQDIGGEILLISQFTLAGECGKGNRPSFVGAARPEVARPLFDRCAELLERSLGRPVGRGVFAAHMEVSLVNDGPVTVIVRSSAPGATQDHDTSSTASGV